MQEARLYHYFDRRLGPFVNLSDLPHAEAERVQAEIVRAGRGFASQRQPEYLARRREVEGIVRGLFIEKGGKPQRTAPHYMVWGACPWLESWYEQPGFVAIPLAEFDPLTVSFTYGDSFPTFSPRVQDGREYRNKVYLLEEAVDVIARYGLPQDWNADGAHGPERYVEAHVWSDGVVERFRRLFQRR